MRPPAKSKFIKLTPPRVLAGGFALIIIIGSLLLTLPAASADGQSMKYIDALFTATSATCVTGLIIVDTGVHFSLFGQIVLLLMVQLGGLGFMTMATWFTLALKRRVSLRDRLLLKESMNHANIDDIVRLIIRVFLYSITIEGIAALYFMLRWWQEMPLGKAAYFGLFHSVSIFNNAGFELFGGFRSLTPYVNDLGINLVSMMLIFFGGIGFVVISELIEFPKTRKLSLHSKVVLSTNGILVLAGAVLILIFEFTNAKTLGGMPWETKIVASFFQSMTLRSAGVNTLDIAELRTATQFLMIVMMFIGAAPGSTGGGIRLTTFAILVGAFVAMLRGKEDVVLFRHRLPAKDIYKAVTFTLTAVFFLAFATMLLSTLQDQDFLKILFETTSAFGTVGLSMGLTADLTFAGKIVMICVMFIGRVGLVTLAFALQPNPKKELYRYPEGKIIIG
ncbi:TrkH family potassium uptake protein [Paenibacillus tyrfis]|uniref:TrkH family potassium uptake protein n=1 Tax=Paenibacillus tyrfis TaxID=1501230 RepID=UPI00209F1E2C|nr:TrkH family potassium uptake protein [Paenibacillus tyrfis]MCP1309599.1 TrkH family potassium uptake protein [Paenibacillus tyrfis]